MADNLGGLGDRAVLRRNPTREMLGNVARSAGQFIAPQLTSYLTQPEVPYSARLQAVTRVVAMWLSDERRGEGGRRS